MNRLLTRLAASWLLIAAVAHAEWETTWERVDVQARLTNEGRLLIHEWLHVRLAGRMTYLERKMATATDQRFVLRKLVREGGEAEVELTPIGFRSENGYFIYRDEVTWWIAGDDAPGWEGETLTFRFEYEIQNAIAPVWDIPAGPDKFTHFKAFPHVWSRVGETFRGWRESSRGIDRLYRLDHDILFPGFPADGPLELNYTLHYDTAWVMVNPEKPIGHGTDGSDYRVTHVFRYLPPGTPPAIEWWRPALRVGSLLGLPILAGLLWIIFAVDHMRREGRARTGLNRAWFEENIVSRPPEVIAARAGNFAQISFAPFLARMRRQRMISVQSTAKEDDDMEVRLRLEGDPASLAPHERLVLAALFPAGPESGTKVLERHYTQSGFDAHDTLTVAVQQEFPPVAPARDSLWWRMQRVILPILFLGGVVLVGFGLAEPHGNPYLILAGLIGVGALALFALIGQIVRERGGPLLRASLGFIVIGLAGVFAMHFMDTVPLTAYSAAGLALFAVWWVAALLHTIRSADFNAPTARDPLIADAQHFIRHELRNRIPDLANSWMPHLRALGVSRDIDRWRRKLPDSKSSAGFTGESDLTREEDWAEALYVASAEEREDFEEEEEDETPQEVATDDKPHGEAG